MKLSNLLEFRNNFVLCSAEQSLVSDKTRLRALEFYRRVIKTGTQPLLLVTAKINFMDDLSIVKRLDCFY